PPPGTPSLPYTALFRSCRSSSSAGRCSPSWAPSAASAPAATCATFARSTRSPSPRSSRRSAAWSASSPRPGGAAGPRRRPVRRGRPATPGRFPGPSPPPPSRASASRRRTRPPPRSSPGTTDSRNARLPERPISATTGPVPVRSLDRRRFAGALTPPGSGAGGFEQPGRGRGRPPERADVQPAGVLAVRRRTGVRRPDEDPPARPDRADEELAVRQGARVRDDQRVEHLVAGRDADGDRRPHDEVGGAEQHLAAGGPLTAQVGGELLDPRHRAALMAGDGVRVLGGIRAARLPHPL